MMERFDIDEKELYLFCTSSKEIVTGTLKFIFITK